MAYSDVKLNSRDNLTAVTRLVARTRA